MKPKKKKIRFSIWYLLVALWAVFLLNLFLTAPQETKIDYSRFKDLLADDLVAEVTIEKEKITGKALMAGEKGKKEEKDFITIRVEDPELVSELRRHGVTFAGKHENILLKSLISWIFPLLLIVVIWIFLI